MGDLDLKDVAAAYERDGFVSGLRFLSEGDAATHRAALEAAEAEVGPLHYKPKVHTILTSPLALATDPAVLDVVEAMLGPDILLHNATYIVKEPGTASHVSWHQDLTFWGLSHDDQVTFWLALSPATELSGCMRMVPGSHVGGMAKHEVTEDDSNVLLQGQTVRDVDEAATVMCPLAPGEASFHHGWTLHASMPNRSTDRRIGLNVQYLAPHVRQLKDDADTALLVRGEDRYGHFGEDVPATEDLHPVAVARQAELQARYEAVAGTM
ncbi:MAG: phytanoyl-CoA dioxygenase family protein [Pseudomonadota bacterium]